MKHETVENLDELIARFADALRQHDDEERHRILEEHPQYHLELEKFRSDYETTDQRFAKFRKIPRTTNAANTVTLAMGGTSVCRLESGTAFGDYELLEEIARGGMGVVYTARQRSLNRIVALKLLPEDGVSSPNSARFLAETQAVAKLEHEHIVPIYEVGKSDGMHYFTMKLYPNGAVSEHLKQYQGDGQKIASLLTDVAQAIDHAHRRGILHRDLKPSNLLLDEQNNVSVADFGLAKQIDSESDLTIAGAIVGTPSYMAPEQARPTGELTTACDIYGLGGILYELLAGRPPFQGHSTTDVLMKVISQEPTQLQQLVTNIDPDLAVICHKCLNKNPTERYGSAAAVAEDLQRWMRGEPILAKPVTLYERSRKWVKRRPAVAALLMLLFISLITASFGVTAFAVEASRRAETESQLKKEAEQREGEALVAETEERRLRQVAQQRQQESNWRAYAAQLQSITHLWQEGHLGQVDRLLKETTPQPGEPDFRGWEWFYLQRQLKQQQTALPGQQGFAMDWNAETGLLAIDNRALAVEIWDVQKQEKLRTVDIPTRTYLLKWSPDGDRLAVGLDDRTVAFIDANSGHIESTSKPVSGRISGLEWRPGHDQLAVAPWSSEVQLLDVISGAFVHTFPKKFANDLGGTIAWTPDGNQLAIGGRYGWVRLFDLESDEPVWLRKYTDKVINSLSWNPSGKLLAVGTAGGQLGILDQAGVVSQNLGGHPAVHLKHLVWQDDVHLLSGADDQLIKLWDVITGEKLRTIQLHANPIHSLAISPDRKMMAAASAGWPVKFASISNMQDRLRVLTAHEREITSLHWNHRGQRFVSSALDGTVRIWNSVTGEVEKTLSDHGNKWVHYAVWGPDDQNLAVIDHSGLLAIWNVADDSQVQSESSIADREDSVNWSPEGNRLIVAGTRSPAIDLLDASTFEKLGQLKNSGGFFHAEWSPDGRLVSARNTTPHCAVWDAQTGERLWVSQEHIESVSWNNDSNLLVAGGRGGELLFYRMQEPRQLIHRAFGHNGPISSVCWSPNNDRIATCGIDATVRIWDAATADLLLTLETGNETPLTEIDWSPDGLQIAAGDQSGKIYLWGSINLPLPRQDPDHLQSGRIVELTSPIRE